VTVKEMFSRRLSVRHAIGSIAVLLCCAVALPQCNPGGLSTPDFTKISENGFDAEDNAIDHNDYAWSMCWFQPDGASEGHVYVGTGNNLFDISDYVALANRNGDPLTELPSRPPEIRRYTPHGDWEKVFDYSDVENDELQTYGFRRMIMYRAKDAVDTVVRSKFVYAASQGIGASIWRSKSGDAGDWVQVHSTGPDNPASIRAMAVHNGKLYLGYAYDIANADIQPGEIWTSNDGINFEPHMQDGFGNANNRGIETLISFNGWLYAGTKNDAEGYEIWKLEGPDGGGAIKVVDHGGPDPHNETAGTAKVFKNKLYIGSMIYYGVNTREGYGLKGCDIIRIDNDDQWETIVGKSSISGYDSGFNFFTNVYCWQLEEHDGWLYAGTYDFGTTLGGIIYTFPARIENFIGQGDGDSQSHTLVMRDSWMRLTEAGADLFKTQDGVHWFNVTQDGFGNRNNYGWRAMASAPDGSLYLGSANPFDGLEVWKASPDQE